MRIHSIGLRQNKLVCVALALMFAGVSFICVCVLPNCVYPYADRVELDRNEVYGELIVLVDSEDHGLIDSPDMWAGTLIETSTNIFYLPTVSDFYERIAAVDGVSSVLKRQITLGSFAVSISQGKEELFSTGRHVGEDFSGLNEFYKDEENLVFPDVSDAPPNAVLIAENTVKHLADEGFLLEKGDVVTAHSYSTRQYVDLVYWGTFKPLDRYSRIDDPEGIGETVEAFIVNESAMGDLWSKDYEYKAYAKAPESIDEVVYPPLGGLTPAGTASVKAPMLCNELMIRLEKGASIEDVSTTIQGILDEYEVAGSGISYKVVSSIYNVLTDKQIALAGLEVLINRVVAIILIIGSLVVGLIGVSVLVEKQYALIELLSMLGRNSFMIIKDLVMQLALIAFIPSVIGSALSATIWLVFFPSQLVASQFIFVTTLFVIGLMVVFVSASVIIALHSLDRSRSGV